MLIIIGLAGIGALHLVDFYYRIVEGSFAGPPQSGHGGLNVADSSWHLDVFAALLVVLGLFLLVRRVVLHFEEQARLLARARERQSQLDDAAKLAKIGFYIFNSATSKIVYCSDQHAASHGLSKEDYLRQARGTEQELPLIHPADREMVRKKYREVVDQGRTVELEYRVPTASGERRVREITTPVFDAVGNVVREVGTSQDVTDQREMEMLLHQSIKMEAIGNLTGGIAHDFNNLLAVILGNLELAKEQPNDATELLDEAITATLKGADLTKSMLSFARRAPLEPTVLDLNKIVRETKNWAVRALPPTIEVETSLLAGLWAVKADATSTESALLNLMLNARDAMPRGGSLTLETANVRIDDEYIEDRHEDLLPGRYVMLAVSDTGIGIAPEIMDRIFDPFFSTKGPGKGSGLGLSMIQGFMKQSGGGVRVYSEPGAGTTFKLYFQAVTHSATDPVAGVDDAILVGSESGRVILVAEDEPAVMAVLVRTLTNAGHAVIEAANGDLALSRFEKAEKVDVVLTDIVMPGTLEGPALVKALRERDPALPAVFMSGYANEATVHGNGLRPEDIRLMKPVGRRVLLDAIDQALALRD